MYAIKTSRGYLTIRPADGSVCELWLNDTRIRECDSADKAARLVAARSTGSDDVDGETAPLPQDIEGWQWISVWLARRARQGAAVESGEDEPDAAASQDRGSPLGGLLCRPQASIPAMRSIDQ